MKKYKRQCNIRHTGYKNQPTWYTFSRTGEKMRCSHFIPAKVLSCDACMQRNFKILNYIYIIP